MKTVQMYLFDLSPVNDDGQHTNVMEPHEPVIIDSDNVLIQELMQNGAWQSVTLLEAARDDLREEIMQSSSFSNSFLAHESKVALKLVSQRLKQLE